MKRVSMICIPLLTAVLMLAGTVLAADSTTYTLDELGLKLSIPNDLIVFTRDLDGSESDLSLFGLEKESYLDNMISMNTYLDAVAADGSAEIIVTMAENELSDFNSYSDRELIETAESFDSLYQEIGCTYLGSELYQHPQAKFLIIQFTTPYGEAPVYSTQYYTIYANKAINVTLHSYSGTVSDDQALLLRNIVDSIVFETDSQSTESNYTPAETFDYSDQETRIRFTIPANWTETPIDEDLDYVDMAFMPNTNSDAIISYSCEDVWAEVPGSTRLWMTRADLDHSYFTAEDAATIFGLSSHEVSTVTYNGSDYYCGTFLTEDGETCIQLTHMENGYIYTFLFIGSTISRNYTDFEHLLDSVYYMSMPGGFSVFNILFSLLLTITVYTVPIIIYRYAIRKSTIEVKKARKITILYGIAAWIVMTIILFALGGTEGAGSAIILWSYVNFRILAGSKTQRKQAQEQAAIAATLEQEQIPCPHCGAFIPRHCSFCPHCGEQTPNRS